MNIVSVFAVALQSGLVYAVLALGYYVTYHILDFPDLTVEGTFLTGAVVYGLTVINGHSPILATLLSVICGALCGALTGVLNVKLRIRPLLCGILVSTALITVNLVATSAGTGFGFSGEGSSNIVFGRIENTLHGMFPFSLIPAKINGIALRDIILFAFFAVAAKLLLDLFLRTKCGLLLRAVGDNEKFVTTLARDKGRMRILGLAIGNGLAALSGVLYTHISGNVNQSMGVGMIVVGLASLIIGISLLGRVRFIKGTTKVIVGAIIYQFCLALAQVLGLPSAYNKLVMAVLFTAALVMSHFGKAAKSNDRA